MPKHKKATATAIINLLKRTEAIRERKPNWTAAYATGRIEGNKPSAIATTKLASARTALRGFGITKTRAGNIKTPTSGYAWYQDSMLWLVPKSGTFNDARKTMEEYFKSLGAVAPRIKLGELTPEQQAEMETAHSAATDDELAQELGGDILAALTPEADEGGPDNDIDSGIDMGDMSDDDAEASDAGPTDEDIAPPADVSEQTRDQARNQALRVAETMSPVLRRVIGDRAPGQDELIASIRTRLDKRLAELTPDEQQALLENAPGRLLTDVLRMSFFGWSETEGADILEIYPPHHPLSSVEVVNRFVDMGSQVLIAANKTTAISRNLIEQRVTGVFDDSASADDKFAAVERLTKALMPVMASVDRLEDLLGVQPQDLANIPAAAIAANDVTAALIEGIDQINACQDGWAAALANGGEAEMTAADEDFFAAKSEELVTRTHAFLAVARAAAEKGKDLDDADLKNLHAQAAGLRGYVATLAAGLDGSDYNRTSLTQLYDTAVQGFIAKIAA